MGRKNIDGCVETPGEVLVVWFASGTRRTGPPAIDLLTVQQLVEDRLRDFLFMAPADILVNQEYSCTWDDPDEQASLDEAKEIAGECGESWPAFKGKGG